MRSWFKSWFISWVTNKILSFHSSKKEEDHWTCHTSFTFLKTTRTPPVYQLPVFKFSARISCSNKWLWVWPQMTGDQRGNYRCQSCKNSHLKWESFVFFGKRLWQYMLFISYGIWPRMGANTITEKYNQTNWLAEECPEWAKIIVSFSLP